MKTIRVTQDVHEEIAPDRVILRTQLRVEHKKSAEAARLLQEQTATVLRALTDTARLSGEEITTQGTAVHAVRRDGKSLFCAQSELKVDLSVSDDRASDAAEVLEKSGCTWQQSYALGDTSYRERLLQKAVAAAKEDALLLAAAAGVRLGELTGIEYAASYGGARILRAAAFSAESVAVAPEPIDVGENVVCAWEIL